MGYSYTGCASNINIMDMPRSLSSKVLICIPSATWFATNCTIYKDTRFQTVWAKLPAGIVTIFRIRRNELVTELFNHDENTKRLK